MSLSRVIAFPILTSLLLTVVTAASAQGQARSFKQGKWALAFYMGRSWGHSRDALLAALRAGGFNDSYTCFVLCSGTSNYPQSANLLVSGTWVARRTLRGPIRLRAELGGSQLSGATGLRVVGGELGFLTMIHEAAGLSAMAEISHPSGVGPWIAGGLSVLKVGFNTFSLRSFQLKVSGDQSTFRLSPAIAAGLAIPIARKWYLDAKMHYWLMGASETEALTVTTTGGTFVGQIPPVRTNASHFGLMIGAGYVWGFDKAKP